MAEPRLPASAIVRFSRDEIDALGFDTAFTRQLLQIGVVDGFLNGLYRTDDSLRAIDRSGAPYVRFGEYGQHLVLAMDVATGRIVGIEGAAEPGPVATSLERFNSIAQQIDARFPFYARDADQEAWTGR